MAFGSGGRKKKRTAERFRGARLFVWNWRDKVRYVPYFTWHAWEIEMKWNKVTVRGVLIEWDFGFGWSCVYGRVGSGYTWMDRWVGRLID